MLCPNCKTENADNLKFCGECGAHLSPASAPVLDRTFSGDKTVDPSVRHAAPSAPDLTVSGQATVMQSREGRRSPDRAFPPGMVVGVDGRFEIIQKIGQGGMGTVYKAKDRKLGRTVALKYLIAFDQASQTALERFEREAQAMTQLSQSNIVTIYDFDHDDDGPYIEMEFVEGKPLDSRLQKGPLSEQEAVRIFEGICRGVAYAHKRGIIHRDIKPANVMLSDDGTPKLLDFGLARGDGGGELSMAGQGMGTLDYASPEQKRDAKNVDARADIYSLGATFYELLTGLRPVPLHLPKVPERWRDVISACCEPAPKDRPRTVEAVLELVSSAGKSEAAPARAPAAPTGRAETSGMTCVACGEGNALSARFCKRCSKPLTVVCPGCQQRVSMGLVHCDQCGAAIADLPRVLRYAEIAKQEIEKGDLEKASASYHEAMRMVHTGAQVGNADAIMSWLTQSLQAVDKTAAEARALQAEAARLEQQGEFERALDRYRLAAARDAGQRAGLKEIEARLANVARTQRSSRVTKEVETLISAANFEEALGLLEKNAPEMPALQSALEKCRKTFPARIAKRDAQRYLEAAQKLRGSRQYEQSLAEFVKAAKLDPTHEAALAAAKKEYPALIVQRDLQTTYDRGMSAVRAGETRQASEHLAVLGRTLGSAAGEDERYVGLSLEIS